MSVSEEAVAPECIAFNVSRAKEPRLLRERRAGPTPDRLARGSRGRCTERHRSRARAQEDPCGRIALESVMDALPLPVVVGSAVSTNYSRNPHDIPRSPVTHLIYNPRRVDVPAASAPGPRTAKGRRPFESTRATCVGPDQSGIKTSSASRTTPLRGVHAAEAAAGPSPQIFEELTARPANR
jgi:hypothetical protein